MSAPAFPPPPQPSAGWRPSAPAWPGMWQRSRPEHPRVTTALVLGIVALAGSFALIVPILLAPIAWYLGAVARREIEREPDTWSGEGKAKAAVVMGMIGTALLIAGVFATVAIAALLALLASMPSPY